MDMLVSMEVLKAPTLWRQIRVGRYKLFNSYEFTCKFKMLFSTYNPKLSVLLNFRLSRGSLSTHQGGDGRHQAYNQPAPSAFYPQLGPGFSNLPKS